MALIQVSAQASRKTSAASTTITEKTAVMLRLLRLPWALDPTQTAKSGAPVQRLIAQKAQAVTRPIFFSAMPAPYVTYGEVALRRTGGTERGRQPRRGEGWEAGLAAVSLDTAAGAVGIGQTQEAAGWS